MISDNFVDDDEILYRRIPSGRNLYSRQADGTLQISSMAFSDRHLRVSADRARLCINGARDTLGDAQGGVVSLVAEDVRGLDDVTRNDKNDLIIQRFTIEIESVPLSANPAHAEIFAIPEFTEADKRGTFKRLCRSLARLAMDHWEIMPED
jgi:hypothetical protein